MKSLILVPFFFYLTGSLQGQGSLTLYPLKKTVPQAGHLNPSFRPEGKFYISVPVLSGFSMNLNSDIAYGDVVIQLPDDSLRVDIDGLYHQLDEKNKVSMEAIINLLEFGFRIGRGYVTVNYAVTGQAYSSLSKDLLGLMIKGNGAEGILGKKIELSGLYQASSTYTKLGFGYNHSFMKNRLTAGLRFNILKGLFSYGVDPRTTGYVYTDPDSYHIQLIANNFQYNMAGGDFLESNNFFSGELLKTENMGLGMDFGGDWDISRKFNVSASLLNLGSIFWDTNTRNYIIQSGEFEFAGIDLDNYKSVDGLIDSLENEFTPEEESNRFHTRLPVKTFMSGAYHFGRNQDVSMVIKNVFLKRAILTHAGFIYHKKVGKVLDLALSYSILDWEYHYLGYGFSLNLGNLSIYNSIDNLSAIFFPEETHLVNIGLGLNIMIR